MSSWEIPYTSRNWKHHRTKQRIFQQAMFDSAGKYYRNGDKSNQHDWMDIGYEWTFTKQWAIPQPSETKENKVSSFKKNRSALVRLPAILTIYKYMEVSINGDTPKWMVWNGKSY